MFAKPGGLNETVSECFKQEHATNFEYSWELYSASGGRAQQRKSTMEQVLRTGAFRRPSNNFTEPQEIRWVFARLESDTQDVVLSTFLDMLAVV